MIQKIAIKRFKKFKEIEVELGPFSILMGENSSGKTTVMQAINLSLNTLYKYDYVTLDSAGQNKVRQKGVGMTSIPGMSLSDNRDLFYAKVSRGKTADASINQGAVIELTDEKSNVFKMQIRENFGSFNIKCVSLAADVQNNPEVHTKAPLFISGFIGLKSTEERVFPMVIQDKMRSGDVSTIIRNLVLDTKVNTPEAFERLKKRLKNDFNFQLEKVEFKEQTDLNVLTHYSEMCDKKELSLDFMSSGSGFMQILQILTPIYRFCPDFSSVVLLDEPDAHLHPNLQTALAKTLRDIQKELNIQIIISTHSTSIIRAAEPSEVVPVSSLSTLNKALVDSAEVESKILETIDAYDLGKSVISGQLVFIEDNNTNVLEKFDQVLGIGTLTGANTIPVIKGRGKDDKAPFQLHEIFTNFLKKDVQISVLRDRDGLTSEWVSELVKYAEKKKVALHVLERYEIENYLLSPELIFRAINRFKDYSHITSVEAIESKLQKFLEDTIKLRSYGYDDTLEDNIYKTAAVLGKDEYRNQQTTKSVVKKMCAFYESNTSFEDLKVNGMGKEALNKLMGWINEELKIKFNYSDLLSVVTSEDIPDEIVKLLTNLRSREAKTAV